MANTPKPVNRQDKYYNYLINGGDINKLPEPINRIDHYLYYLCVNGFGGGGEGSGVTKEMLDAAVAAALQVAKNYTDNAVSDIANLNITIVDELPTEDIDNHTIYFVRKSNETCDEYMYIDDKWELIGDTAVDLTGYAKEEDIPTKTSDLTNDSGFITKTGGKIGSDDAFININGLGITGDTNSVIEDFEKIAANNIEGTILKYDGEDTDERYVKVEDADYLPLSGGDLTDGAKIKIPYGSNRYLHLGGIQGTGQPFFAPIYDRTDGTKDAAFLSTNGLYINHHAANKETLADLLNSFSAAYTNTAMFFGGTFVDLWVNYTPGDSVLDGYRMGKDDFYSRNRKNLGTNIGPWKQLYTRNINLYTANGDGHGGYIDFFWNGETSYSGRIIESSKGLINIQSPLWTNSYNFDTNAFYPFYNGQGSLGWSDKRWNKLFVNDADFNIVKLNNLITDYGDDGSSFITNVRIGGDYTHLFGSSVNELENARLEFTTYVNEPDNGYTNEMWSTFSSVGMHLYNIEVANSAYDYTLYGFSGVESRHDDWSVFIRNANNLYTNFTYNDECFYGWKSGNVSIDLGSSYRKWKNIYANNGVIQTSDMNEKDNIQEISDEQALNLICGLIPSTYTMKNGTNGRTHWGMISQHIEELLNKLGWSSLDFAGFIKSPKMHIEEEERDENGKVVKKRVEEIIEGEYNYSLRYDEFIAPMIKVIQNLNNRVVSLEEEIAKLKQN